MQNLAIFENMQSNKTWYLNQEWLKSDSWNLNNSNKPGCLFSYKFVMDWKDSQDSLIPMEF